MNSASGRMIVVTGAASGIGRCLTGILAGLGDRVWATDLREDALAAARVTDGWPTRVRTQALDVRDPSAWAAVLDAAAEETGLDVLFNVAGYLKPGRAGVLTPVDIDMHVDVNVKGVMYGTAAAASRMSLQGRGHIVNVASLAALAPIPGLALYSASKYAVRGFSLAAAIDLAPKGIAVSVVCPDAVATPMLDVQRGDPDAALTFSGPRVLTALEVAMTLAHEVLERRPLELVLPRSRAILARAGDLFPGLLRRIEPILRRKGMAVDQPVPPAPRPGPAKT